MTDARAEMLSFKPAQVRLQCAQMACGYAAQVNQVSDANNVDPLQLARDLETFVTGQPASEAATSARSDTPLSVAIHPHEGLGALALASAYRDVLNRLLRRRPGGSRDDR